MAALYMSEADLTAAIGPAATEALIAELGGTRFYVPRKVSASSPIARAIGEAAAAQLSEYVSTGIGGLAIEIPSGASSQHAERKARLRTLVEEGRLNEAQIATALGISQRTVRRARAKFRDERQASNG